MISEVFRSHLDAGHSLPAILTRGPARGTESMVFLGRDDEQRVLPYGVLHERAQQMAAGLIGHGLAPGEPVILFFDDEQAFVLALWAVLSAGGVAVPLSAPASFSAGDEALGKILAVHGKCAERGRRSPLVLSDVPFESLVRVASFQDSIARERFIDARRPDEQVHDAQLPEVRLDDLAMFMFSSGSTGDAKGVRLTHGQILSNLVQLCERSELTAEDRSLSWLPMTHDMGLVLFHVCHTLAGIAQFKMTPLMFARDPGRLLDHVGAHRASVLGMPNFGFDQLCRAAEDRAADAPGQRWSLSSVRIIYNGAEPIDPELCRRFVRRFAPFGLRPHVISPGYGIAEASVVAAGFPYRELGRHDGIPTLWVRGQQLSPGSPIRVCAPDAPDALEIAALGPPMAGMRVRVLDDDGRVLPESVVGHLELQGPNVTRGYFDGSDSEWCGTGDMGFVHDGVVYISGRAKDVLFINGRNRFSNDIETALCRKLDWPANQLAVVGVTDPKQRRERVIVFFRQGRGAARVGQGEQVRRALEELLAYPVAGTIGLATLPKTTSGKIRRFALRAAALRGEYDAALAETGSTVARALTPREAELAVIVREIVADGTLEIDPEVPLSRYGLDSVGFMQLAFRIGARLARPVAPHELIRAGSLAEMVAVLSAAPSDETAPALQRGSRVPLTARQRSLWAAWLLDPSSRDYNETHWLRVEGPLDREAWLAAARQVIATHPMLHAVVDDESLVLPASRHADVALEYADEGTIEATMAGLAEHAFDLQRGPLLRISLIAAGSSHIVFLSAHHIVTDGWSIQRLIEQIFAVYAGEAVAPGGQELWFEPARFSDEHVRDWRARFEEAEPIQLPTESNPLAKGQTGQCLRALTPATSRAVREWARIHGSEFTALAGGLMALLGRLAGVNRPLLGTVASGRYDPPAQSRVGYFALTLPLIADLAPEASFASVVEALEADRLAMLAGIVPDVASLDASGRIAQALRVVYVHQNTPSIALPRGLRAEGQGLYRAAPRTDLCISTTWQGERLVCQWEYDAHRFSAAQIAGYAELLDHVLSQLLAAPARPLTELDLLSAGQRSMWRPYQDTARAVDFGRDVVARFEALAAAQPDLPALSDDVCQHSYGELRARVNALCWQLAEREIARGDRVALLTDRSADYVIALLAVLKMGAVAIPLDPALPRERIEQILADSAASLLVITPGASVDPALLEQRRTLCFRGMDLNATPPHPGRRRAAGDPAYLIFTSGSTGQPKGVLNTHGCLTNLVEWVTGSFGYRAGELICQFAPFSFDVSMAEILPSLCAGLHIHVLAAERRSSPDLYLDTMRERRVNVATVTPAYLAVLNEVPARCHDSLGALRLLILGGEALETDQVRRFRQHSPHVAIVNVYGPTETTVLSSAYPVPDALTRPREWQPLGRPIANTEIWVLDEALRVCPATVTGTVYIGGEGLSHGYWQDQARTDAAFRTLSPDGGPPRRFYCTGDLARLASDGELDFVGRADTQIKLRGFRIELGEIETVLARHPHVQQAVVVAAARPGAERVLVAYYTGETVAREVLDAFLRERLPAYMVPSLYVHLSAWPLSANRKVDRSQLTPPQWDAAGEGDGDEAMTATERRLAAIWCELLGVEHVRRTDHFSMLGGSSLNAAQLVNRVRQQLGRELPLSEVMRAPTLAHIARVIDGAAASARPEPMRGAVSERAAAASEAQSRMVFLDRAHPGTPLNNIPLTLSLGAPPDDSRLQAAMTALAERHRMLRACLVVEQEGVVQRCDAPAPQLEVLAARDTAHAIELLEIFHRRAFVLDRGPLWRVAVARAADSGRSWLALSLHHAIADGVTLVRVLEELDALYQGRPLPSLDDELSYSDYVAWQRALISSPFGEEAARFWSDERQRRPLPRLPLPPHKHDEVGGRQFVVDLEAGDTAILRSICAERQVSPFVLMLSLFGFVLGQRVDARNFALGVTLSGRSRLTLEKVPGLFVNTLPLPFDWAERGSFAELLERVASRLVERQDFQDFPLNRVMNAQKVRDLPFNVLFNEELLPADLSFGGASATLEGVSTGIAKLPLLVSFLFGGPTWRFRIECREHLGAWTAGLLEDLKRLVKALDGMAAARLEDLQTPDEQVMALLGVIDRWASNRP